ncbi:MAG: DUF1249 domain-containing protein [Gammaproteobacteria bacterium]|nr:DUF1249 domain-containing protein [Gammaproteobacteria bacterium]
MLALTRVSRQLAPAMLLGNRPLGLGALIDVYERNYAGLWRLFGHALRQPGWHVSHSPVNGELHLEVERRSAFTTVLRMTYLFPDEGDSEAEPDLIVNLYDDARVAEVVHWSQRYGTCCEAPGGFADCWRRNCVLGKWLQFLTDSHHGPVQARTAGRPPFQCRELRAVVREEAA